MNKASIYRHLSDLLANGKDAVEDVDIVLKYMVDYFSNDELTGFLEHVETELDVHDNPYGHEPSDEDEDELDIDIKGDI